MSGELEEQPCLNIRLVDKSTVHVDMLGGPAEILNLLIHLSVRVYTTVVPSPEEFSQVSSAVQQHILEEYIRAVTTDLKDASS